MTDTYIAAAAGETILVELETATAGTYAAPLSINLQRSIKLTANAEVTVLPNATNPSHPGQTTRVITSFDWSVSGQGILNIGDDATYATWLTSGAVKNVRVSNANTGGVVLTGPAILTSMELSSDGIGKKAMSSVEIVAAGPVTQTAHS